MGQKNFHPELDVSGEPDLPPEITRTPLTARLYARFLASRLDRDVEAGLLPEPGSAMALHMIKLTSLQERESLARSLRSVLSEPDHGRPGVPLRVPIHAERVAACQSVIDDITLLLHSPRPVRARGMARLRMLLSDGRGPLYRNGSGSLAADLRGVLAAL